MVVVVAVAGRMHVAGDPVAAVVQRNRAAEEAARPHPGQAERRAVGAQRAVGQHARRLFIAVCFVAFRFTQAGGLGMAGDVVVAGFPVQGIEMEDHVAAGGGAVQAQHPGALVVDGPGAQFGAAFQWLVRGALRDAAVDHVDRAADRAGAIQQRRRALEDLDLVGQEGFDGHRVVDADRGHVAGTQPVAEHLHPGAIEAADHRTADARPEEGRLHPGQSRDRIAQGGGLGRVQALAGQDLHRPRQLVGGGADRRGPYLDRVQVDRVMEVVVVDGLLGEQGGGQDSGEGKKQWKPAEAGERGEHAVAHGLE